METQSTDDHIKAAKAYLLRSDGKSGVTMYDHLVGILTKVLDEKPSNALDLLEEYSWNEKKSRFHTEPDVIQDKSKFSSEAVLAEGQKHLFLPCNKETVELDLSKEEDIKDQYVLPDIMENMHYFEQAGVGLGREEMFRVLLAVKQLTNTHQFKSCRFWGKMLGTKQNYYVVEVEFREGQDPYQNEFKSPNNTPLPKQSENLEEGLKDDDHKNKKGDGVPKPSINPRIEIPTERYGEGCNQKVYFVCNNAGFPWTRLPLVTPQQIVVARIVRKLLTGDLDAKVVSYPPFPGDESNYLRAQIARISAATHISPQGYYLFEEDDNDDEDEVKTTFVQNMDFEVVPVNDLCNSTNAFWVHHQQYILPQGRTTWFNPSQKNDSESDFDEDDDDDEESEGVEPEEGPALLTVLSEDAEVNSFPAWSAVKCNASFNQYAFAVMHSNLWPGAHAYALESKFENIYIGYGLKYSAENYSPPAPPATQQEYAHMTKECDDPTVEQERAVRAAEQELTEAEEDEESEDYDEEDDD